MEGSYRKDLSVEGAKLSRNRLIPSNLTNHDGFEFRARFETTAHQVIPIQIEEVKEDSKSPMAGLSFDMIQNSLNPQNMPGDSYKRASLVNSVGQRLHRDAFGNMSFRHETITLSDRLAQILLQEATISPRPVLPRCEKKNNVDIQSHIFFYDEKKKRRKKKSNVEVSASTTRLTTDRLPNHQTRFAQGWRLVSLITCKWSCGPVTKQPAAPKLLTESNDRQDLKHFPATSCVSRLVVRGVKPSLDRIVLLQAYLTSAVKLRRVRASNPNVSRNGAVKITVLECDCVSAENETPSILHHSAQRLKRNSDGGARERGKESGESRGSNSESTKPNVKRRESSQKSGGLARQTDVLASENRWEVGLVASLGRQESPN
uniref:Uncharacterized protein n=1 Tax=Vespula pensylvanica TaxID=30213 RepID=A0A834NQ73_VESPE|nr:hypothetical protein H0235_012126 [Vespula pensylvanica]